MAVTQDDYYALHARHMALMHRGTYDAALAAQLSEMEAQLRVERARQVQARHERQMAPVRKELMTLHEPIPNQEAFQRPTDADIKEAHAIWEEYGCAPDCIREVAKEMGLKTLAVRQMLLGTSQPRKLTDEQVREMRRLYDESDKSRGTIAAIGRQFGVCRTTARDILKKRKWGNVV